MNKKEFQKVEMEKLLKAMPSESWQEKTAQNLLQFMQNQEGLSLENNNIDNQSNTWFEFFNSFINNGLKKVAVLISIVVLFLSSGFGYIYMQPERQAMRHIVKTEKALDQLRAYVNGEFVIARSSGFGFLGYAYANETAEDSNLVDEIPKVEKEAISELINIAYRESQLAIEATEEIGEARKTTEVLAIIDEIQDETIIVLAEVIEVVENDEIIELVVKVIEETSEQNMDVEEAQVAAREAVGAGEEEVVIEVKTALDQEKMSRGDTVEAKEVNQELKKKNRITRAQELLAEFEGVEMNPEMQKTIDLIQNLIDSCEAQGRCQDGKIKGQTIALVAKIRNEKHRKEKKGEVYEKNQEADDLALEEVPDIDQEGVVGSDHKKLSGEKEKSNISSSSSGGKEKAFKKRSSKKAVKNSSRNKKDKHNTVGSSSSSGHGQVQKKGE